MELQQRDCEDSQFGNNSEEMGRWQDPNESGYSTNEDTFIDLHYKNYDTSLEGQTHFQF